jgi:hypothetical protein
MDRAFVPCSPPHFMASARSPLDTAFQLILPIAPSEYRHFLEPSNKTQQMKGKELGKESRV